MSLLYIMSSESGILTRGRYGQLADIIRCNDMPSNDLFSAACKRSDDQHVLESLNHPQPPDTPLSSLVLRSPSESPAAPPSASSALPFPPLPTPLECLLVDDMACEIAAASFVSNVAALVNTDLTPPQITDAHLEAKVAKEVNQNWKEAEGTFHTTTSQQKRKRADNAHEESTSNTPVDRNLNIDIQNRSEGSGALAVSPAPQSLPHPVVHSSSPHPLKPRLSSVLPPESDVEDERCLKRERTTKKKTQSEETRANDRRKKSKRRCLHRKAVSPTDASRVLPAKITERIRSQVQPAVVTSLATETAAHVQTTGFQGEGQGGSTEYSLQELLDKGFEHIEWNGRDPVPILDASERIVVMLLGQPNERDTSTKIDKQAEIDEQAEKEKRVDQDEAKGWEHAVNDACSAFTDAQIRLRKLEPRKPKGRRGRYYSLRTGFSHGGGSKKPHKLKEKLKDKLKQVDEIIADLRANNGIQRIAGFASSGLRLFAPKLHGLYRLVLASIVKYDPQLEFPFQNSVFPATTFNLGPGTVTWKHLDPSNLAFGKCAVTALGAYDHKRGGHLILFDLKLVIDFPPGATILLPSAVLLHGNTRIQKGEIRMSLTQYAPAGLFRWARSGFQRAADRNEATVQAMDNEAASRFETGLEYYSKLSEF